MISVEWRFTYFLYRIDRTDQFVDYAFAFESGNILKATKGTDIRTVMWSITRDGIDDKDIDFSIGFNAFWSFRIK